MKKVIDIKLLKILVIFYSIVSFISLTKITYFKLNGYGYEFSTWKEIFLETILLDWMIVLLIMSLIAITTKLMIYKKMKWIYIVLIHLFFSLFIGVVIYFLSSIIYLLTGQIKISEINLGEHLTGIISVLDLNFLIYFSMISIVYTYYYIEKTRVTELEKSQLSNQLTNARLNILKYKLHPHFLFNTLNSISSLIESDTKLAQDTIADFGDLLRELLELDDTSLMPLFEELNISKKFLDIMSLRFSDHLTVNIDIEKNIENVLVPSLILLPILENSIKHGYSYNTTSLKINLKIRLINNKVNITIENNGQPLHQKRVSYGNGLQNTIDRLDVLYKNNYSYTMKNVKNKSGVKTTILLPLNI